MIGAYLSDDDLGAVFFEVGGFCALADVLCICHYIKKCRAIEQLGQWKIYFVWLNPSAYLGELPKDLSSIVWFARQSSATDIFVQQLYLREKELSIRVSTCVIMMDGINACLKLRCSQATANIISTWPQVAVVEPENEVARCDIALERITRC
jgi:hypothetical protein